jgi:hypothetical protein
VSGPPTSAAPLQLQREGESRGREGRKERRKCIGIRQEAVHEHRIRCVKGSEGRKERRECRGIRQEAVHEHRIRCVNSFGAYLSGREASHTGGMPASLLAASLPPRCTRQANASSV